MARKLKSNRERFESYVQVDESSGCWIWQSSKNEDSYGVFYVRMPNGEYKKFYAHRFSYQEYTNEIPEGMCVLHNCPAGDNPSCVNPTHLRTGSRIENNADRDAKGRTAVGSMVGNAKHSEAEVLEVRRLGATGLYTYKQIAAMTGVGQRNVGYIINREIWKHI